VTTHAVALPSGPDSASMTCRQLRAEQRRRRILEHDARGFLMTLILR
jgi:hypothetical protein